MVDSTLFSDIFQKTGYPSREFLHILYTADAATAQAALFNNSS
jgi:hypothetical protein